MKTTFALFLLFLFSLQVSPAIASATRISDYTVIFRPGSDPSGRRLVATRSFRADGVPHLLAIDPQSMESRDLEASSFKVAPAAEPLGSTCFVKGLDRYNAPPYRLQNHGVTHAQGEVPGVFLTVDLCPSKRPFERELFVAAAATGKGRPVPVAVAVSGVWLKSHPEELAFLKRESAAGHLAITWVNHSMHHPYDPKVPLAENFLLTPGTDFDAEVLEVEKLLLAEGLVPSPFFRFPGLVADGATVQRLRQLSLIPIGSDAWLAKGEKAQPGSIILVHGNGNEPKGIKLVLPLLKGGELQLRPLREAFAGCRP